MQPAKILYHLLHEVVCARGLALPELTDHVLVDDVYVDECQHPMVARYLRDFARLARNYIRAQTDSRVALVIYNGEFAPIERWTFTLSALSDVALAPTAGSPLQALINQIKASTAYLGALPARSTFRVLAYLDEKINLNPLIRPALDTVLPYELPFIDLHQGFTLETRCHTGDLHG